MQIKCWGSRGSIPVSGKEYVKYGGDTTCIEIRTDSGDIIIVDAGTGIRRLGNALIEQKLNSFNFLFTHSHWDHIIGFPAFKPLFFGNTKINVSELLAKDLLALKNQFLEKLNTLQKQINASTMNTMTKGERS